MRNIIPNHDPLFRLPEVANAGTDYRKWIVRCVPVIGWSVIYDPDDGSSYADPIAPWEGGQGMSTEVHMCPGDIEWHESIDACDDAQEWLRSQIARDMRKRGDA